MKNNLDIEIKREKWRKWFSTLSEEDKEIFYIYKVLERADYFFNFENNLKWIENILNDFKKTKNKKILFKLNNLNVDPYDEGVFTFLDWVDLERKKDWLEYSKTMSLEDINKNI